MLVSWPGVSGRVAMLAVLVVSATSCRESSTGPDSGLRAVSAGVTTDGTTVTATLDVRNDSSAAYPVTGYECSPLSLRVYRTGTAGSAVAWASDAFYETVNCIGVAMTPLPLGESRQFSIEFAATAILGDSLPPGAYRLTVSAHLLAPALASEIGATTVNLQ
jgi:hypothetical protein